MRLRNSIYAVALAVTSLPVGAQVSGSGAPGVLAVWGPSSTATSKTLRSSSVIQHPLGAVAISTAPSATTTVEVQANVPNGLGPVLTLTNLGGYGGAQAALDLNSYPPSTTGNYNPGARIEAFDDNFSDDILFQSNIPGAKNQGLQTHMIIMASGFVGIGNFSQSSPPQAPLDVQGTTRTQVLTITGGSDLAEPFHTSGEQLRAGAVVVIDPKNPETLKLSEKSYDRRVVGVLSGANGIRPGIRMHQGTRAEGDRDVALSGRVYALADATNGPISPGDLLTTSDAPGYAMKVTDYSKAQGAVLGKAMSSLTAGKGMILVLVTLQ